MSSPNKASIKRGKPSYFMSILGVTLVLFVLGLVGWLVINANKLGNYFKESVEVRTYLRGDLNPKDSVALMEYISAKPYVKTIKYVNKEEGKKIFIADGNTSWDKILDYNPLPNAIFFKVKNSYLQTDSLATIKADLKEQTYVSDVEYPEILVGKMNYNIRVISIWMIVFAIILAVVVIILIDNTIKLAMFSNRFLIKTMQMVGATRSFIARPMNIRAIINGAIGGVIASVAVYLLVILAESQIPDFKTIRDNGMLAMLFGILILLGILISLFSTNRSVTKYLKMKLDDLY
ncbi:cell division protein FtsX [Terrimonas rubra]|uniref:Cell division protein FtsX n=1 Tax=Terrimonas rubra TaxID=1035890 RepID=A0ABW6A2D6_9BACT